MPYYLGIALTFLKEIIREFWWLLVLIILGKVFIDLSKKHQAKKKEEKEEIKDWATLEVRINREILQTPKAMEQVFNSLNVVEKGYLSLELIGINREMHFIVRAPREYKNLVESQLYAQYPEIEIKEIDDYFSGLSPHLPNKEFDLWGTEVILEKENYYPVKTYSYFEEPREEKRIDPIASLAETFAKLQKSEWCILQIFIKFLSSDEETKWREEGRKKINALLGKKEEEKITWKDWIPAFFKNLLLGLLQPPVWPAKEEKGAAPSSLLSSGEKEVIKAIEKKITQLSFSAGIRLIYIAPKSIFNEVNVSGFMAFLKQFNSKDLNAFKINDEASTVIKTKLFQNQRLFLKKRDFYQAVLKRKPMKQSMILNTEELATLYHFPALKVKTPTLIRVLSKKGEPPARLPTG